MCCITEICLTFLPICLRFNAKIIFEVLSKNPSSFFQLIPHLQCCNPINCCFIFLPQTGHLLLLAPIRAPVPVSNIGQNAIIHQKELVTSAQIPNGTNSFFFCHIILFHTVCQSLWKIRQRTGNLAQRTYCWRIAAMVFMPATSSSQYAFTSAYAASSASWYTALAAS